MHLFTGYETMPSSLELKSRSQLPVFITLINDVQILGHIDTVRTGRQRQ